MHSHAQNTWGVLNPCGVGDPWSPAPCVTNGDSDHPKPTQKGSLQVTGQATMASLSPHCRPTAWSSWPSPAELALQAILKTLLGEGLGQRTPGWSWGAVWERLGSPGLLPPRSLPEVAKDCLGTLCLAVHPHPARPVSVRTRVRHESALSRSKVKVSKDTAPSSAVPAGDDPFALP